MRPVVFDAETYFDRKSGYSLSAKGMTQESYTRDARFEAHGAAIKWTPTTPAVWYDERELRWQLQNEDWSDVFLICHHAQFDGLIQFGQLVFDRLVVFICNIETSHVSHASHCIWDL